LLLTLADIRDSGNIVPQPTIRIEKRQLTGQEIALVTVFPADAPPVRYKGRIWVRTGPRRSIASAQEERILNERRLHRDLPFDLHPHSSCPLDELHWSTFEEYLTQAFAQDVLAANERSREQRLVACRMIDALEAENFATPGLTDYRNPHIAEALKVLGYVQRFGIGIATAQRELTKNGNPPVEFQVEPNSILAVLRKSQ
jgi:predicted HTH transcriptional regulator